jgi:hypothetical protein
LQKTYTLVFLQISLVRRVVLREDNKSDEELIGEKEKIVKHTSL